MGHGKLLQGRVSASMGLAPGEAGAGGRQRSANGLGKVGLVSIQALFVCR